ncbi:MAG: glucose-1-phosphate cytidylyltransferase [Candidatus Omnitrophica bacterium]|nr:glucose-1-phosphate cytidylyltransferase [Candidatus Omnitrophota bacterium]
MKVVILCGGQGMRLREETETKPKPMVEIGGMPILWHIMKTYATYGFKDFILCLGYKGEVIKEYFYNYEFLSNDFTIELGSKNVTVYPRHEEQGWKVTLVDTGINAMTGSRVKKIEKFIDGDTFMLTYGDGVIDMDINLLNKFHKDHGRIATVTGVSPQSRYGELVIRNDHVVSFSEKPTDNQNLISGGYFVFNKKIFSYLSELDECVLEKDALQKLAADGELKVHAHKGFWQCMDTYRDYVYLQELWKKGNASWKRWDK